MYIESGPPVLESLFGNRVVEKILFYLLTYNQGYVRGISSAFAIRSQTSRLP